MGSGIMPHEVDKRLVAAAIYLARVDKELDQVPMDTVWPERQAKLKKLCAKIKADIGALEEARTGRKANRPVPKTIEDVSDMERYRANFVDGVPQSRR